MGRNSALNLVFGLQEAKGGRELQRAQMRFYGRTLCSRLNKRNKIIHYRLQAVRNIRLFARRKEPFSGIACRYRQKVFRLRLFLWKFRGLGFGVCHRIIVNHRFLYNLPEMASYRCRPYI